MAGEDAAAGRAHRRRGPDRGQAGIRPVPRAGDDAGGGLYDLTGRCSKIVGNLTRNPSTSDYRPISGLNVPGGVREPRPAFSGLFDAEGILS